MTHKIPSYFLALIVSIALFSSCEKPETGDKNPNAGPHTLIVNYGSFSGSKSTITEYYEVNSTVNQNAFQNANGVGIASNVQNYGVNDSVLYFMCNEGDKVHILDKYSLSVLKNPVTTDIVKPRFISFAENDMAYISCWGNVVDWSKLNNSYIAKFDLINNTVAKKIALPGGPEGSAIVNGNLYASMNYTDSIALVDLSSENISYIETPAVSSYMLKDNMGNLYVSMVSTYSDPSTETGLAYLNTSTNTIDTVYSLAGVSSGYGSIMAANSDFTKIYVIASEWVEVGGEWVNKGAVKVFDVATKSFESNAFYSGEGINGISVNPKNDHVYIFIAEGDKAGKAKIFDSSGNFSHEVTAGINPQMAIFVE